MLIESWHCKVNNCQIDHTISTSLPPCSVAEIPYTHAYYRCTFKKYLKGSLSMRLHDVDRDMTLFTIPRGKAIITKLKALALVLFN